ncbi:MAG: MFS transporter, partial [Burkholderiaceae bacterium]|nr:MFS transporter [Burkholderiaceae bacterium]
MQVYRLPGGTVTALGITQLIGWGTTFYLPAVFAHRIAADTGWSLSLVFAAFSWNLVVAGATSRRVGEMIDRHGAARVMTIGSALMAMGLLMLATATTVVQLFAAWTVLGVASRAALYDAAFAALAAIFGQGARRSISLLTLWGGLASTVFWPLGHMLGETIDWRWSLAVYALLNLLVCLPLHRSFAAPATHCANAPPTAAATAGA